MSDHALIFLLSWLLAGALVVIFIYIVSSRADQLIRHASPGLQAGDKGASNRIMIKVPLM